MKSGFARFRSLAVAAAVFAALGATTSAKAAVTLFYITTPTTNQVIVQVSNTQPITVGGDHKEVGYNVDNVNIEMREKTTGSPLIRSVNVAVTPSSTLASWSGQLGALNLTPGSGRRYYIITADIRIGSAIVNSDSIEVFVDP